MATSPTTASASSPAFHVEVPVGGEPATEVLGAVDAALAAEGGDVRVRIEIPSNHPEREAIACACEADPRITLAAGGDRDPSADGAMRVTLPPSARPGSGTFDAIATLVHAHPGTPLELTVPGRLGPLERFGWAARLPRRRLVRVVSGAGPSHTGGGSARRIPGPEVGLGGSNYVRVVQPAPPQGDLAHERAEHLRHRARSATYRARADRTMQRLSRERMRAKHERAHARLLERRLAATGPKEWAAWRGRQLTRLAAAVPPAAARAAKAPFKRGRRLVNQARRAVRARR